MRWERTQKLREMRKKKERMLWTFEGRGGGKSDEDGNIHK